MATNMNAVRNMENQEIIDAENKIYDCFSIDEEGEKEVDYVKIRYILAELLENQKGV